MQENTATITATVTTTTTTTTTTTATTTTTTTTTTITVIFGVFILVFNYSPILGVCVVIIRVHLLSIYGNCI